jgi:hypothetical protein
MDQERHFRLLVQRFLADERVDEAKSQIFTILPDFRGAVNASVG